MNICNERLANAGGMGKFNSLLSRLGKDRYPILIEHLPVANCGMLDMEYVVAFQSELETLKRETKEEQQIVLRGTKSKKGIYSLSSESETAVVFALYDKMSFTLSAEGFQIIKTRNFFGIIFSSKVFSSKKFTLEKVSNGKYLYTDTLTKKAFESPLKLDYDEEKEDTPYECEVVRITTTLANEYSYIIEPLLRLTKASIETQNPIIWC